MTWLTETTQLGDFTTLYILTCALLNPIFQNGFTEFILYQAKQPILLIFIPQQYNNYYVHKNARETFSMISISPHL